MANIPLVQVPNAPQTGNMAVPVPVGAIRTPDVATMPVLGASVFSGAERGMQALAQGVQDFGSASWEAMSFAMDFQDKMQRANDDFNFATADRLWSEARANHAAETSTMTPDKYGKVWQEKYLPKLQTQLEEMPMSQTGRARLDAWTQTQIGNSYADITVSANKEFLNRGREEVLNFARRAVTEGRPEDGFGAIARGVQNGFLTPEEGEAETQKLEEDERTSAWTTYIQQKPAEARRVLRDAQSSGKPPKGMRSDQLMQFRRQAEGVHSQLVQDVSSQLLESIEADPTAVTDKMIDKIFSDPRIDGGVEIANKFKEHRAFRYADTPEGKADKATSYSDLWQAIFSYDAQTDISMADPDTHKREYQKLQQRIIESAPEGERKPFLDTLNDMVSQASQGQKSRTDEISRGLLQQTDKLAEWGQFGQTGDWKKEKRGDVEVTVPKDVKAWLNVQTKRLEVTNEVRRLMRENPDLTVEQAQERFKGVVAPYLDPAASFLQQPEEEEGWMKALWDVATWGDFVMNPTANNPNVMAAGVSWGSRSLTEGLVDADEPLPPVQSMPPQPSATPAAIVASMPPAKQPIASEIASMAESEGLGQFTPHLMLLVAQESNFNPNQTISTSSARGLFQLLNADRKRYGSDSSLQGQIRAGLAKTKDNITAARKALGRDPDPFELYVVHYQGIGAGPAILKNPDGDFRATLDATGGKGHAARVMKANPWLVRDGVNSNQDFINWVRKRLSSKASQLGMA